MTDGRKHLPARATLTVALTLGLAGAGIAGAGPAAADDLDSRAGAAAAEAERLQGPADARRGDHVEARKKLRAMSERVDRIQARIDAAREVGTTMRSEMAEQVMAATAGSGPAGRLGAAGTSLTALPAAVAADPVDPEVAEESTRLLANVLVVTDDSEGRAQEMTDSLLRVDQLRERRVEVRASLREQRAVTTRTSRQADRAAAALETARTKADDLQAELRAREEAAEAERAAEAEAQQAESSSNGAVAYAMAQVGKSYVWGASGPSSFDCSGLTMAAWATEGVSLPHNSGAQYAAGTPVSESELRPGDLVFYYSPISHVGMYVGNGQVVNALNPGSGVQVSGLHDMPYSGAVRPG